MVTPESARTFVLVPGCWHPATVMEPLRLDLESHGHKTRAPELPLSDPDATFDDHAKIIADVCRNETDVTLVGHSRAGNTVTRAAGLVAVERLVYLCASFAPATLAALGRPTAEEVDLIPARYPEGYIDSIRQRPDGLSEIDPEVAKKLFYSNCSPGRKAWAAYHLKPQRRSDDEPLMEHWPEVEQHYILCTEDQVTNPDWSRYVARNWLSLEPIELDGDHSPFLSQPERLAKVLMALGDSHDE